MIPAKTPRYRRSPYLVLYWSGKRAVLLNAHTLRAHSVHPELIGILSTFDEWRTVPEATAANRSIAAEDLAELHKLTLLETEEDADASDCASFTWDPLELAVQRRTAHGGYWPELGGPPPPVLPRFADRPITELPPPAPAFAMTLTGALGQRRSVRTYAVRPMALEELSTLLHHSARIVRCVRDLELGERMLRPFPTAGARSELEIYVLSVNISGLEPGAFYYDALHHRLLGIRELDDDHRRILHSVHAAAGGKLNRDPATVLLVTAVFERLMWKYRNLSLSLVYKDVGALLQTLYLVATALNLAPCAIGAGDEADNSRWLGLDPLRESQVGCFVCGPGEPQEA